MANSYNELFGLGSQHDKDADLGGWWLLQDDVASTTVKDQVGSNDGILNGGNNTADISGTGPNNWLTKAFHFDGSSDYVELYEWDAGVPHSILARGRTDDVSVLQVLVGNKAIAASDESFVGGVSSTDWRYQINDDSANEVKSTSPSRASDIWYSYAASQGGTGAGDTEIYLDASAVGDSGTTADPQNGDWEIGRQGDKGRYWDGLVCDVSLWDRELSSSEITEWHNGPEPTYISGAYLLRDGSYDVGTWKLPGAFHSGSNGTITYEVEAVEADGTSVDTATASSGTLDLSSATSDIVFLVVRASNTGGYDIGDHGSRTSSYGSANDGYYEVANTYANSFNELYGLGSQHSPSKLTASLLMQDDDTNTNILDETSNNNDFVSTDNTDTLTADGPGGYLPKALEFDGSTEWADRSSNVATQFPLTIAGWAYPTASTPTDYLYSQGHSGSSTRFIAVGIVSSKFIAEARNGFSTERASTTSNFTQNAWQHFAAVFHSEDEFDIYLNGGSKGSHTAAISDPFSHLDQSGIASLRRGSTHQNPWQGRLAGINIIDNYAMSQDEVIEDMGGPEVTYTSGASLSAAGVFNVGTWELESPFSSGSNGTVVYTVIAVNAAGDILDSYFGTGTTGTLDLSSNGGNTCYLLVKASNLGGADIGDFDTRTSSFGEANDGYYELTSVTASASPVSTNVVTPVEYKTWKPHYIGANRSHPLAKGLRAWYQIGERHKGNMAIPGYSNKVVQTRFGKSKQGPYAYMADDDQVIVHKPRINWPCTWILKWEHDGTGGLAPGSIVTTGHTSASSRIGWRAENNALYYTATGGNRISRISDTSITAGPVWLVCAINSSGSGKFFEYSPANGDTGLSQIQTFSTSNPWYNDEDLYFGKPVNQFFNSGTLACDSTHYLFAIYNYEMTIGDAQKVINSYEEDPYGLWLSLPMMAFSKEGGAAPSSGGFPFIIYYGGF